MKFTLYKIILIILPIVSWGQNIPKLDDHEYYAKYKVPIPVDYKLLRIAICRPKGAFASLPSPNSPILDPFFGLDGMGGYRGFSFSYAQIKSLLQWNRVGLIGMGGVEFTMTSFDWSALGDSWKEYQKWSKSSYLGCEAGIGISLNIKDEFVLEGIYSINIPIWRKFPKLIYNAPDPINSFIIYPVSYPKYTIPKTLSLGIRRGSLKVALEWSKNIMISDYRFIMGTAEEDKDGSTVPDFTSDFIWKSRRFVLILTF